MKFKIIFDVIYDGLFYIASANFNENEHIVTQAEDFEKLKFMIKDALECHFDKKIEEKIEITLNVIVEI